MTTILTRVEWFTVLVRIAHPQWSEKRVQEEAWGMEFMYICLEHDR